MKNRVDSIARLTADPAVPILCSFLGSLLGPLLGPSAIGARSVRG